MFNLASVKWLRLVVIPVGNWLGRLAYNNILKPIKDDNLRNKLATDLNLAGNDFDKGWDRGLKDLNRSYFGKTEPFK